MYLRRIMTQEKYPLPTAGGKIWCENFSCKMTVWACASRFTQALYTGDIQFGTCRTCKIARLRLKDILAERLISKNNLTQKGKLNAKIDS